MDDEARTIRDAMHSIFFTFKKDFTTREWQAISFCNLLGYNQTSSIYPLCDKAVENFNSLLGKFYYSACPSSRKDLKTFYDNLVETIWEYLEESYKKDPSIFLDIIDLTKEHKRYGL